MRKNHTESAFQSKLSPKQRELVERFISAFNAIHKELRRQLGESSLDFAKAVKKYAEDHPTWGDATHLDSFRQIRNFLAHDQTQPDRHLAIPTLETVHKIEQIYERLAERVIPKFEKSVTTVNLANTLADVFRLIKDNNFSQFPVYDVQDQYRGLLTENGITRWLSYCATDQMTLVGFEEIIVESLLDQEEKRRNCLFVSEDTAVPTVVSEFNRIPSLEAVLITAHGQSIESLLGIVTLWDILRL